MQPIIHVNRDKFPCQCFKLMLSSSVRRLPWATGGVWGPGAAAWQPQAGPAPAPPVPLLIPRAHPGPAACGPCRALNAEFVMYTVRRECLTL